MIQTGIVKLMTVSGQNSNNSERVSNEFLEKVSQNGKLIEN